MTAVPAAYAGRLLADVAEQLGHPVHTELARALRAVPRHAFLPDRLWLRDGRGGYEPCDRATHPDEWMAAAYSDAPLVTQFTEGMPSSSASMPSTVLRMLELADLQPLAGTRPPGRSVIELGTGTAFNAALLCELLGSTGVTTVELDPVLAERAERNLKPLGYTPTVARGDGAAGWLDRAPYDRLLATFSVDHIPAAWLAQVRPGGRIITPWWSAWCVYGTLALDIRPDGTATGHWHDFASYMPMRSPEPRASTPGTEPSGCSTVSRTGLSPWAVAGGDLAAEFHIGLTVPGASFAWDTSGQHAHTRLELEDAGSPSWAAVDYDGRQAEEFTVTQAGPRRLWDEVAAAYARWETLGRPGADRHRLTVGQDGTHTMWVDAADRPDRPITSLPHASSSASNAGGRDTALRSP
ncbi:methyltransferase [Streptomyces sp. NPDC002133]|uniref:methyltransferase n=1 Tax=Streptomyces sp. NPDC002133 TaxID=3154409 RepID=UPI003327C732